MVVRQVAGAPNDFLNNAGIDYEIINIEQFNNLKVEFHCEFNGSMQRYS